MERSTKPPASPKTKRQATGASPKTATRSSPWGKLSSKHAMGGSEADEDFETQAFVKALESEPNTRTRD